MAEAVEILRSMYPREQLAPWAAQSLSEALADAHFAGGLWIRNKWVHSEPAPFVVRMRQLLYSVHDDDVSNYVLEALWRVLNSEDCPTVGELLERGYPDCGRSSAGDV